jgi:hypothetical protein
MLFADCDSMDRSLDALFVNSNSSEKTYQALVADYSEIEPPTWALLLAGSCRSSGFGVGILDCDAERLEHLSQENGWIVSGILLPELFAAIQETDLHLRVELAIRLVSAQYLAGVTFGDRLAALDP